MSFPYCSYYIACCYAIALISTCHFSLSLLLFFIAFLDDHFTAHVRLSFSYMPSFHFLASFSFFFHYSSLLMPYSWLLFITIIFSYYYHFHFHLFLFSLLFSLILHFIHIIFISLHSHFISLLFHFFIAFLSIHYCHYYYMLSRHFISRFSLFSQAFIRFRLAHYSLRYCRFARFLISPLLPLLARLLPFHYCYLILRFRYCDYCASISLCSAAVSPLRFSPFPLFRLAFASFRWYYIAAAYISRRRGVIWYVALRIPFQQCRILPSMITAFEPPFSCDFDYFRSSAYLFSRLAADDMHMLQTRFAFRCATRSLSASEQRAKHRYARVRCVVPFAMFTRAQRQLLRATPGRRCPIRAKYYFCLPPLRRFRHFADFRQRTRWFSRAAFVSSANWYFRPPRDSSTPYHIVFPASPALHFHVTSLFHYSATPALFHAAAFMFHCRVIFITHAWFFERLFAFFDDAASSLPSFALPADAIRAFRRMMMRDERLISQNILCRRHGACRKDATAMPPLCFTPFDDDCILPAPRRDAMMMPMPCRRRVRHAMPLPFIDYACRAPFAPLCAFALRIRIEQTRNAPCPMPIFDFPIFALLHFSFSFSPLSLPDDYYLFSPFPMLSFFAAFWCPAFIHAALITAIIFDILPRYFTIFISISMSPTIFVMPITRLFISDSAIFYYLFRRAALWCQLIIHDATVFLSFFRRPIISPPPLRAAIWCRHDAISPWWCFHFVIIVIDFLPFVIFFPLIFLHYFHFAFIISHRHYFHYYYFHSFFDDIIHYAFFIITFSSFFAASFSLLIPFDIFIFRLLIFSFLRHFAFAIFIIFIFISPFSYIILIIFIIHFHIAFIFS